jgi:hypothetical protein
MHLEWGPGDDLGPHSSSMEESNANERKCAMGFYIGTTMCKAFLKEFVGRFWGKLWILITSHGFLVWSCQNNYVLANHTHLLHLIFHLLHLLCRLIMVVQGGVGDVTT